MFFFRFKAICFRMLHYYQAIVDTTIILDPLFATHAGYIIGNQLAFLSTSIYCIQAASHVGIFCYKHILSYSSWDCYSIRFAIYIWQMKGARKMFIVLLFIITYLCIQCSIWYLYIIIKFIYSYSFLSVIRMKKFHNILFKSLHVIIDNFLLECIDLDYREIPIENHMISTFD